MTTAPFHASVLTLFPEMFPGPLGASLAGKAAADGLWSLETIDIRDFARDKHRSVDDAPFGGGAGMVMRPDVIDAALHQAHSDRRPLIYLTPRGRLFDQTMARTLAKADGVTLLCGRYEGVDQRVMDAWEMEEVSLGDFVLSGGEAAAITLLDAVIRLLPGVLGSAESLDEESFEEGILEYPHYTRPENWNGHMVPEVLRSGHHKNIQAWRKDQAEKITRLRRPDLWDRYVAVRDTTATQTGSQHETHKKG